MKQQFGRHVYSRGNAATTSTRNRERRSATHERRTLSSKRHRALNDENVSDNRGAARVRVSRNSYAHIFAGSSARTGGDSKSSVARGRDARGRRSAVRVSGGRQVARGRVSFVKTAVGGSAAGVNPRSESRNNPNRGDTDQHDSKYAQECSVQKTPLVRDRKSSHRRETSPSVSGSDCTSSPDAKSPPARKQTNPNSSPSSSEDYEDDEDDDEVEEQQDDDQDDDDDEDEEDKPLWHDHVQRWCSHRLAESTQKRYKSVLNKFIAYLRKHPFKNNPEDLHDVNNVTLAHMEDWVASYGDRRSGTNTNSTKRKHVIVIKSFWKSLFYHWQTTGVIRNAADGLRVPPRTRRLRVNKYMKVEQVHMFLKEARRKSCTHTCLLGLMYYAGLRVAELCELKHDDIEFFTHEESGKDKMLVKVREDAAKGCKYREIVCRTEAVEYLRDQLEHLRGLSPNDYYFPGDREMGNRGVEGVYRIVKTFGKMKHINMPKVTPHWFRHAFATHAKERGKSILAISRDLGHSSKKVTEIYLQTATGAADD